MKNSYVSYNAVDEIDAGAYDDSEAIVSAANKKRKAAEKEPLTKKRAQLSATIDDVKPSTRKRKAKTPKSAASTKPKSKAKAKAKPKTNPKTKAKPKTTPKSAANKKKQAMDLLMSSPGLITRGVHAGLRGFDAVGTGAQRMSLSAWAGVAAAIMMITVTILAWTKTPEPAKIPFAWSSFQVVTDNEQRLPDSIWRAYVNKYPQIKSWIVKDGQKSFFKNPSQDELADFAAYLDKQNTIAQVNDIKLSYVSKKSHLQRAMYINVTLRSPEMPVILANGQKAWVDAEGVLLPGVMPVREAYQDRPYIRGIENNPQALTEVLSFWDELEEVIESDLISNIYLDRVMQRSTDGRELQRGIVLVTKQGTRINWGRIGDERFGLNHGDKIRNLLRTLKSQGDLRKTQVIDVRHSDPKYILSHGS